MNAGPPAEARRHTVFTLGGVAYAVEADQVKRLLPAQAGVSDLLRLVGKPCPLLDLRALLRLPPPPRPAAFILIVEVERRSAALLVDTIKDLIALPEAQIVPLPAVLRGREREWFRGIVVTPSGLLIVMRLAGVLREATTPRDYGAAARASA